MEIDNVQVGDLILTGLCYGYTDESQCGLPLMVANVQSIIKDKVLLCEGIDTPETYVDINDIYGIPLNRYILNLLGFKEIEKTVALCPGAPNFYGTAYEAQIDGHKVQIIEDDHSYKLCQGKTTPTISIKCVHDIQNNKKVNGIPLKIHHMIFYNNHPSK